MQIRQKKPMRSFHEQSFKGIADCVIPKKKKERKKERIEREVEKERKIEMAPIPRYPKGA